MNENSSPLERELARQLAPVAAPETLWERICEPQRVERRGNPVRWMVWAAAAAVVLIVCAGWLWKVNRARELQAELPSASRAFDFRSNDFGAIRSWVKNEANIDIDLPDGAATPENTRALVMGVRLIRFRGQPSAAIDYRVGDGAATLVVSGKHAGPGGEAEMGRHLFDAMKSAGNERLLSWSMRDQNYTIAYSGEKDLRGACLLCHSSMRGLMTAN